MKIRQLYIHILGCIAFLAIPILFSPDRSELFGVFKITGFQKAFVTYLLLLVFFYFSFFLFIPKFYFSKKYLAFIFSILISYALIIVIPLATFPHKRPDPFRWKQRFDGPPPDLQQPPFPMRTERNSLFYNITEHFLPFFLILSYSLVLKTNDRWKQAEKEKINAELSYLKAQINPHFLFNTLNSIYALAIEKSDTTATAIVKLSGMMRYVLSEINKDFVSMEKEINYVSDYIELQKIRLGNTIKLTYTVTGETTGKKIAPLILIPFIENAFKHGVNAEENSAILILIEIEARELILTVDNNKVKTHLNNLVQGGLGVENTKNRLQLLYPLKHVLIIDNNAQTYCVNLKIDLV